MGLLPLLVEVDCPVNWRTEWSAIHDRILGVERTLELFLLAVQATTRDNSSNVNRTVFHPHLDAVYQAMLTLKRVHIESLPPGAITAIDRFVSAHRANFENPDLNNIGHTIACVTALAGLRVEMSFVISDTGAISLRRTERALEHLQRSLVVDGQLRHLWRTAFDGKGETACEKLGAAHLLMHGIWAFKVSGAGERTDLVYGEPLDDIGLIARGADALVLTEWKVASQTDVVTKVEQAISQAERYTKGVLGGIELAETRFVVVVSMDFLPLPSDTVRNSINYRIRNIATAPSTPSNAKSKTELSPPR